MEAFNLNENIEWARVAEDKFEEWKTAMLKNAKQGCGRVVEIKHIQILKDENGVWMHIVYQTKPIFSR